VTHDHISVFRNKKMFRKEGSSERAGSTANFEQLMQMGVSSVSRRRSNGDKCEEDDDAESTSSMTPVGGIGPHHVFKI